MALVDLIGLTEDRQAFAVSMLSLSILSKGAGDVKKSGFSVDCRRVAPGGVGAIP